MGRRACAWEKTNEEYIADLQNGAAAAIADYIAILYTGHDVEGMPCEEHAIQQDERLRWIKKDLADLAAEGINVSMMQEVLDQSITAATSDFGPAYQAALSNISNGWVIE